MEQPSSATNATEAARLEAISATFVRALDEVRCELDELRAELLADHGTITRPTKSTSLSNEFVRELDGLLRKFRHRIAQLSDGMLGEPESSSGALNASQPETTDRAQAETDSLANVVSRLLKDQAAERWRARFGKYLSDEFRDDVTDHFHEAKRRTLGSDSIPQRQNAED